jgi:hypothetical protein
VRGAVTVGIVVRGSGRSRTEARKPIYTWMTSSGRTATSVGGTRPLDVADSGTCISTWPSENGTSSRPPGARAAIFGTEVPLLCAWAAIGLATAVGNGTYGSEAAFLVTVGTLLFVLCAAIRVAPAPQWSRMATVVAGTCVLLGLHYAMAIYGSEPGAMVTRVLSSATTVVIGMWLILGLPRRELVTYGAIVVMVAAGVAMIIASPSPKIDVWNMLQKACRALSGGHNIYTIGWAGDSRIEPFKGFAYLPGAAVLLWPFHALFGDVRYGILAAMAATAVLLARIRSGSPLVLLGAFAMLYSKSMFGLAQSWMDPLVLTGACATAYAVVRGRRGWAVVAFAVCLTCKQQAWLLLPVAAFWKDFGWRRAALSAAGAGAFVLPWILTAPRAFYESAIAYQIHLPPRYDSLSLDTTALLHGWSLGVGFLSVATLGALAFVLWRVPRNTYGFLLGSAVVMAVFNLANKQSFFNEWALAAGLGLAALVFDLTLEPEPDGVGASQSVPAKAAAR